MKKLLVIVVLLLVAWQAFERGGGRPSGEADSAVFPPATIATPAQARPDALSHAFQQRLRGAQVQAEGIVLRVLPDDADGSRHQRFIVRLPSGQTVLIAHNIDLAPRVESLESGAPIAFFGEYEWNERGGVVHWTHRDPDGQHTPGWIRYRGREYQ